MDISVRKTGPWLPEDRSWLGSAHGTAATRSITLDISAFTANTHYPNGFIPSGIVLAQLTATNLFVPYAGNAAEVQTVTITGTPTGGTFTLTFGGQTTAGIAYNAAPAAVRTALEALSSVAVGDLTVTGSNGGPYSVTFTGQLTGDQPVMTASGASLTGGSSPAAAVTTGTPGGSSAADGSAVALGHLFSSVQVTSTADQGAALLEHGKVRLANLPANHGLDAAARRQMSGIIYL